MALHVVFRVGSAEYALPASLVLHLESYEAATHVPGAPSYVAGIVNVRGRVVPVVDLRARFGLPAVPHEAEHRIVVVQIAQRVAALLVDSAREVLNIEDTSFEKPPELIEDQTAGFVSGIAKVARRLFLLVDVPRIIGEELHHG